MKSLVIIGNSKMGNQVGIFNLPPKKTCTPTSWCLKGKNGKPACYALRNNFKLPNVIKSSQERYEASKRSDFSAKIIKEIKKHNLTFFRIHSSGDFYSTAYIKKWQQIATNCPNTLFRATTRRRDLSKEIEKLNKLPNVIIRESLDTERKCKGMNLKFAAIDSLKIAKNKNAIKCANNCDICGHLCWKENRNVIFQEH